MILSFGLDKNLRGRVANRAGVVEGINFQVACGGLGVDFIISLFVFFIAFVFIGGEC